MGLILYLRCDCRHVREVFVGGRFLSDAKSAKELVGHVFAKPCPECAPMPKRPHMALAAYDPDAALGRTVLLKLA